MTGKEITDVIEAAASVGALILSIAAIVISIRTEKKTKNIQRLARREKDLKELVDRIEKVDVANLASPNDDDNKRALIVAAKMEQYGAIFSIFKHSLPEKTEKRLSADIASMGALQDAAVDAANRQSADMNERYRDYVYAMANFVNDFKRVSAESLTRVSAELSAAEGSATR